MSRSGSRRGRAGPASLAERIEAIALHIGDRIGARIARAIAGEGAAPARARKRCHHEGCTRDAAARGLCKSHYNLMLYHRREAERGVPTRRRR